MNIRKAKASDARLEKKHTHTHFADPLKIELCGAVILVQGNNQRRTKQSVNKAVLNSTSRSFALFYSLHCVCVHNACEKKLHHKAMTQK